MTAITNYLVSSRFFISSKIPKPNEVSAFFSYNYFVTDELENDQGDSRYDPRTFTGTSYLLDDNGNKLIIDNLGRVVSEDVLTTRSPRHVELAWTQSDDTLTQLPSNLPSIESCDATDKIIREEEISSLLDASIKTFDQTLQARLVTKFRNLNKIQGLESHTGLGNQAINYALKRNRVGDIPPSNQPGFNLPSFDTLTFDLMNMNAAEGTKKVNDLGQNVEAPALQEAQSLMLDVKYDRRLLEAAADSDISRNYFTKRKILNYFNQTDAENRALLPSEEAAVFNAGVIQKSSSETASPYLKAYAIVDEDANIFSKFNLMGYIVERYGAENDFILEEPQRTFYVESKDTTNLIDTEVKYGTSYYYTIRSVYVRDFYDEDKSTEPATQRKMRQYFASNPTDPVYIETKETTPPAEPDGVFFKFNYNQGQGLILTWQYPVGRQRDTKYFQIFRRTSIDEPFTCIAELDFNNSNKKSIRREHVDINKVVNCKNTTTFFDDTSFKRGDEYIYAVAAIDAHGLTSGYSAQTKVSFNINTNKIELKDISRSGAPKQYPNFFVDPDEDETTSIRTFTQDVMKSSGKQKVRIYLDPTCEKFVTNGATRTGLSTSNDRSIYKMHFINLDRQKDDSIEIRINDLRNNE